MNRLLRRAWLTSLRRVGYVGTVGGIALGAGLVLALALPAFERDTRETTRALVARSLSEARRQGPRAPTASPAESARAYVAGFPLLGQNAADVAQLFTAAQARHLQLQKGEYQLKAEPNAPFVTYTATFPVHGDYDTLKGFSADVLNALPHASMDELRLSRDSVGSTTLDAVVRFTFFYRSA